MNRKFLEIKEYKLSDPIPIKYFDLKEDLRYLKKTCFGKKGVPIKIIGGIGDNNIYIENRNPSSLLKASAGIIQLKYQRIYLSTKVRTHLFYMLSFLKSDELLFDPEKYIDIEEGTNFYDAIGRQYLNELEKIYSNGLLNKFKEIYGDKDYLIGRLDINGQIKNDINGTFKFSCCYDELTQNILENQIVLMATHELIPIIKFNEDIRQRLKYYERKMSEDNVELVDIQPDDCDKVVFDFDNVHYRKIILLAKVILMHRFIESSQEGRSIGFNFVVDPSKVIEDFMTQMLDEVIRSDFDDIFSHINGKDVFYGHIVERGGKVPDRVLRLKNTRFYIFPIDIKYKEEDLTPDYNQIAGYGGKAPGSRACILIYPDTSKIRKQKKDIHIIKEQHIRLDPTKQNPGKLEKIKLYTCVIDLYMYEDLSYHEFIKKIKSQIRDMILDIIQRTIKYYIGKDLKLYIEDKEFIYQLLLSIYN